MNYLTVDNQKKLDATFYLDNYENGWRSDNWGSSVQILIQINEWNGMTAILSLHFLRTSGDHSDKIVFL